jgi:pilus assembly protein FimV
MKSLKGLPARLVLGVVLGFYPLAGYSLGLGKLKIRSALNEPLQAEVEFTSISDGERRGLKIELAPRSDFEAAGAERAAFLSQLKFIVVKRPDGRYFLNIKTDGPLEEPFLHFLVQVEWPGGRLVREYTALIDPPAYMVGKAAPVEAPSTESTDVIDETPVVETVPPPGEEPVVDTATPDVPAPEVKPEVTASAPDETAPDPTPVEEPAPTADTQPTEPAESIEPVAQVPEPDTAEPIVETVAPPSEEPSMQPAAEPSTPTTASNHWADTTEYAVTRGDTLWRVAESVRADKALTIEQVMVAIFKNNRDAFYGQNLNNLRAGKILKMPEREAIEAVDVRQAHREFSAHYSAWQEYKLKVAASSRGMTVDDTAEVPSESPGTSPTTSETPKQPAADKDEVKVSPKSAEEMLKIVRATESKQVGPKDAADTESPKDAEKREQAALAERATTLEESLESKQLENRELAEKIGQVRAQIKNEKRLIELENKALAEKTATKPETQPETKPETKPSVETKPEVKPPVAEVKPETKPETKPVVTPTKAPTIEPKRTAPPTTAPVGTQKNFLASILDDALSGSMLPIAGGVLAVLVGIILMVYLRRRQRSIAEFEESILASDAMATTESPTASGENSGQAATTGDTSFLSDFSKSGMGHMQTDEVDPIAEAEVYLAYGRDETAEEILKEAIIKNPDRQELKQKLLEIYHQRSDVNAFETLAEELYAAVGGRGGKMWEKVEEMGRKLNPENPMFRGGAPATATRQVEDRARTMPGLEMGQATAEVRVGAMAASGGSMATQVLDTGGVDFDFDAASTVATSAPEVTEAPTRGGLDFDLGETATSSVAASAVDNDLSAVDFSPSDSNLIDFEGSKSGAGVSAASEDDIKWDADDGGVATAEAATATAVAADQATDTHWDETATKLDLAKAYIDMGDADGARSILDEVLAEGNEQQKKQAAELAAQIG